MATGGLKRSFNLMLIFDLGVWVIRNGSAIIIYFHQEASI